jgi:HEAT repeat protein
MPSSTKAPAAAPAAAVSAPVKAPTKGPTAFGIAIADVDQSRKAPVRGAMSRQRRATIIFGSVALVALPLLYLQYRTPTVTDPDVADHPAVVDVNRAETSKNATDLSRLARSDDVIVARRALAALGRIGDDDALRTSATDPRPEIRSAAINELGDRATVADIPVLSKHLQDPAPEVRMAAIRGIAGIPDFSIFDQLVPMLSDPQSSVRRGAQAAIEDRVGLKFSDFDANGSAASRAEAISKIRSTIPKFKQRFEAANAPKGSLKK